jgi:hypothetical protein
MPLVAIPALVAAFHLIPCEYHIDCSGWPGVVATEVHVRITTADGAVFMHTSNYQPAATPEDVRDVLAYRLGEGGFHGRPIGKTIHVLEGAKKSAVRSIEFTSEGWKPDVRWVPLVPDKKK